MACPLTPDDNYRSANIVTSVIAERAPIGLSDVARGTGQPRPYSAIHWDRHQGIAAI